MRRLLILLTLACLCPAARGDDKPRPAVRCLAFSPDGKALAAGLVEGDKGELRLLDGAGSSVKWRQPQAAGVRAVCFLPGGKTIVAAVGPSLLLIEAATGKAAKTLGKHGKPVASLALSADGKTLASGGQDGAVKLWDVGRGEEIRSIQVGVISALSFAPQGDRLLAATDREGSLWEVKSGKKLAALDHGWFVSSVVHPEGREAITAGYDGCVRLWDAPNERREALLQSTSGLYGLAYEPRKKTLAYYGSGFVGLVGIDRKPDDATAKRIAALIARLDDDDFDEREAAERALVKIGFLAEPALRRAKEAKSAEVRIRSRRALQTLASKPDVKIEVRARALAFSPDGKTLVVGGDDGLIRLYDPKKGEPISDGKR